MPVQAPPANRTILRDLIEARGLKYGFVADRLGLSPSLLTRLLGRERPLKASELVALTSLLGVEAEQFFDGSQLILSSDTSTNEPSPAGAEETPQRGRLAPAEGEQVA